MELKKSFFLFCFLTFFLFSCEPEPAATGSSTEKIVGDASLETFVDQIVQPELDSGNIAGMGVGVMKGGEVLLAKTYGYAELEHDVPMPLNASFEIGSVTKQFTAAAILQLAEEGKLNLEDDFTQYVDFDTKGRSISIKRLLDHTSGIKSYTESPIFGEIVTRELPRDTLLRMIEKEPFDFEPGEAEIYNNTAFYILGLIIEEVSGQSYEDYVDQKLFVKAGMDNSYYCDNTTIRKDRAHGYSMGPEGDLVRAAYLDHTWPYAAGSLCSTVQDLLKWNQALHNGEVLSEENYQLLITPDTLNDGTRLRYAKGIANFEYKGHQCISHGGGINGFLTESRYFPEQELTVVVLVNTTGPIGPGNIADQISDELLEIKSNEPVAYNGNIEALSGIYSGPVRGQSLTLAVEGKENFLLLKEPEEEEADTLRYYGNYWSPEGQRQVYFIEKNGQIAEMRIDQISGYYRLKRE